MLRSGEGPLWQTSEPPISFCRWYRRNYVLQFLFAISHLRVFLFYFSNYFDSVLVEPHFFSMKQLRLNICTNAVKKNTLSKSNAFIFLYFFVPQENWEKNVWHPTSPHLRRSTGCEWDQIKYEIWSALRIVPSPDPQTLGNQFQNGLAFSPLKFAFFELSNNLAISLLCTVQRQLFFLEFWGSTP